MKWQPTGLKIYTYYVEQPDLIIDSDEWDTDDGYDFNYSSDDDRDWSRLTEEESKTCGKYREMYRKYLKIETFV